MDADLAQLREELMVQEIMLQSLEDASDDAADERREIERDIARLKRLIAKAERGEPAIEDYDDSTSAALDAPQPQRPTPSTPRHHSQAQPGYFGSPSSYPYGTSQPLTPQGRQIETQPSATLSVRKRDRSDTDATGKAWQSKSRRTTPPAGDFAFGSSASRSNADDFDFIDLTGDDIYDSAAIARSIQDENRRKERTSVQASRSRGSRDHASSQGQSNAFERLMQTQQLNSGPMSFMGPTNEPAPSFPTGGLPDTNDMMPLMPGAYNDAWDQPAHGSSAGFGHNSWGYTQPMFGQVNVPGSRSGRDGQIRSFWEEGMQAPAPGVSLPPLSNMPASQALPQPQFQGPSQMGFASVRQRLGDASSSLTNLIDRTNNFDFINGLDEAGNPLNARFHDVWSQIQDPAVTGKELEDLLKNIRPDMDIEEKNRERTPAGLKATLYLHQELALSWLKNMEEGTNKGGILADDMGLGKTISMISLMTIRPATARPKTNLIIAPVALMKQWAEEIRTKLRTSHSMSTFIYHGKKVTTEDLLQYDVVLTTYGTLAAELKRLEKIQGQDRTVDLNDKAYATKIPLLHPYKAKFHRIILDEAQCIKNDRSLTAKAAWKLRGTYRWCLTGTPMMNGVHELFSLLCFLQIKPYTNKEKFNRAFRVLLSKRSDGPTGPPMERLRVLLKAILLRRMKTTKIDGKPIIDLPRKTEEQVHVELSPDEKEYYSELEKKSQVIFNKYLRDNTVGKNYSNVLVLLLRLRQACCHPHLNYEVEEADNASIDNEQSVKDLDHSVVQRIKSLQNFECPVCYDAVPNPSFFVPCGHDGCRECLVKIIDSALREGASESGSGAFCRCPECRTNFDPKQCFTYETFKKIHMPELVKRDAVEAKQEAAEETEWETDTDAGSDDDADDVDNKGNLKGFIVDDNFWNSDEDDESKPRADEDAKTTINGKLPKEKKLRKKKKPLQQNATQEDDEKHAEGVKPGMLKSLRKASSKNQAAYKKYMAYLRKTWLPSAKVTECMKLLNEFESSSSKDEPNKTIIFSQWTLLLDLLEVAMYHEGFGEETYRRYDGSMKTDARVQAAGDFQKEGSKVKTILVSLRAGNAGLNLTSASRVIILDPFWNPYIEMQAVDRAYRIGQKREVKVYRILTTETVEDRIMDLQKRKKEIVEAALDETESKKIARLSTDELRFLFNGTR